MPDERTYTYRDGEKIELEKGLDQFVVRALPDEVAALGVDDAERVSSASSRVTVRGRELEPSMRRARELAPTHHAYRIADTGEEFLISDRVFVTFREPLEPEALAAFAGRYGLVQLEEYSPREFLFQLTDHTGMNPVKLVVALTEQDPLVESADHDLNVRASTYQTLPPTDPAYARQWHLHSRRSDPAIDARSSTHCEDAWAILGHGGLPEVVVGVTDDGCKLDHPDFDSPDKFAGWGYLEGTRLVRRGDPDADAAKMYQTGSNHGTSCAGVVAAEADALMTVGAAPGCRLLPIKWESSGRSLFISDSKLMAVLDYVAGRIDVLSNSWGIVPTNLRAPIVRDRIAALAQAGGRRGKGILFLWAAGNESCPIQHDAAIDVPYTNGWDPASPSPRWVGVQKTKRFRNNLVGVPGVMHVAALSSTAQRSHYSNYGTGIELCAPSSNSHRFRRLPVRGLGVTTATGSGLTDGFGGTSSATPLVAGIAALVISANPQLTALGVASILKRTAARDLSLDGYPRTPAAGFDPDTSWDVSPVTPFDVGAFQQNGGADGAWSPWFGHGRVDAAAAVAAAMPGAPARRDLALESSPEREIPDGDPAGIEDRIGVDARGRVESIRISVDISHTWIGDLRVTLVAPGGQSVVLHSRTGSSQDDIRRVFDTTSLPAVAALLGHPAQGDWVLRVQDVATRDTGTLHGWKLELAVSSDVTTVADEAGATIPDDDPGGVTRTLALTSGTIDDIAIAVDITHPWVGDLRVALTPPGRTAIVLHDHAGREADNIVRTWRAADVPALAALLGTDAGGTWRLTAADTARRDIGKLNRWSIEVTSA
jgi:subtilisin-like proprotein convertase family protein/subtilisin family serine protease